MKTASSSQQPPKASSSRGQVRSLVSQGAARLCSQAHLHSHLSQPRAHIRTCTDPHTQLPRHTPCLSLPHAAPRVHTHLKPMHLQASFRLRALHRFALWCHLPGPSAFSIIRALGLFLFRGQAPSHVHIHTSEHTPSLPFSLLSPGHQKHAVSMHPTLCTRTHTFSFFLVHSPSCTGSLSFSSLSFPSACSFPCSQSPKHIYTFKLTLPPPLCVGVHICKKPGNPADAVASAPSPASTTAGPAWKQQLSLGYGSEEGGR